MSGRYDLDQSREMELYSAMVALAVEKSIPANDVIGHVPREAIADLNREQRMGIMTGQIPVNPETRFLVVTDLITSAAENKMAAMPYQAFLDTLYWDAVRAYVRYLHRDSGCQLCTSYFVEVHHLTYEHRGCEWRYLEDLAVLCNTCHEWVHKEAREKKALPPA